MPRPDLAAIDVNYRRIPIIAIGKDVYCDSRLIIQKLEQHFPNSQLTPPSTADAGVRKLFESWTIDGGVFWNSVKLMPFWTKTGLLDNKEFLDDREKLTGRRMTEENMRQGRPDGITHLRQAFEMLETTFLADERKWILGTEEPTIADIDAVWPFEWIIIDQHMKECLPKENISERRFPKTFAYVKRFMDEVNARKAEAPKPTRLDGPEMKSRTESSTLQAEPARIISDDPLQLREGDKVEVYASDYGFTHKDRGALIGLTINEVVIRNSKSLHLHFPRWNFHIEKIQPRLTTAASISKLAKVPKMRLIYHHGSPYTRKVFMVALEYGLAQSIILQKVVVCPIPFPGWSDNNEEVAEYNPMAKIPCLIPEDVPDGIFDSRTICDYLESVGEVKPKKDRRYWQLHTLHACADGIMDASVLLVYENRIREPRGVRLEEWVQGQKTKINRALDRFETAASQGILTAPPSDRPASADEVAVAVAVGFMDAMMIEWRKDRPSLVKWFANWEKRKSFVETPHEKEWNAGGHMRGVSKI